MSRGCDVAPWYHRHLLPAGLGAAPSGSCGPPFLGNSEEDSQSRGSAAAPGPASVFKVYPGGSHPLPKPLFLLNSPRLSHSLSRTWRLAWWLKPLLLEASPWQSHHTPSLRQQLLGSESLGIREAWGHRGGTQVDHWDCVLISPSHCEEALPLCWLGSNPTASMLPFLVPGAPGRPECSDSNKTLGVCPGQRVCPLWRSEL